EVATELIVALVEALVILIPLLVDAGLQILGGVLKGIADNIGEITEQGYNIIINFLNAVAKKIGDIIDAGMNLVVKFLKGIADGITKHKNEFVKQGSRL